MAIFENSADREFFLEKDLIPVGRTWLIESVGVDANKFYPKPEPEDTPVVLMASRMLWDKGVGDLVEAARILTRQYSLRVVLVGTPDPGNPKTIEEQTLREWQREGVIEWWGWQADMPSVYAQCHIVALPSLYEGLPSALLEAAACGKPIVATDIPGCRQVVSEGVNGYLVPPRSPKQLADALGKLLSDPKLREQMGKASRQIVLRKFTHTHINAATLAVYRKSHELAREGSVWGRLFRN
jgi:glycosyltransferase involved in cell wall biosynthesis